MKEKYSDNEALYKAEAYCTSAEHCVFDVQAKLELWNVAEEYRTKIIEHLKAEKYIDEQRYCVSFVRDKYRFNQWGRVKIIQALRLKRIPSDRITESLEAIDEEEYFSILSSLIEHKKKSIKARTEYERNGKLIRFAISRGFEMEVILRCVKQIDDERCFE